MAPIRMNDACGRPIPTADQAGDAARSRATEDGTGYPGAFGRLVAHYDELYRELARTRAAMARIVADHEEQLAEFREDALIRR
jgi:hypothetical protein